jgi:hypothetical protein
MTTEEFNRKAAELRARLRDGQVTREEYREQYADLTALYHGYSYE